MKIARFVLKVVAVSMAVAAAACCVVAYWDKIIAFAQKLRGTLAEGHCCCASEYDDYADWD